MSFSCSDVPGWPPVNRSEAVPLIIEQLNNICNFLQGAGTPGLSSNQIRTVPTGELEANFNSYFSGGVPDTWAIVIRGNNELFVTEDAGTNWNIVADNTAIRYATVGTLSTAFNALWPNSLVPTHAVVVVDPRELWATRNNGTDWTQLFPAQDQVVVVPASTPSGTFNSFFSNNTPAPYAVVLEGNNFWVTEDSGGVWTQLDPLNDEDLRVVDGAGWATLYSPLDTELLGEFGSFLQPQSLVINNVTKKKYATDDTGITWTDVTAPGQRDILFVVGNEAAGDTLTDCDYLFGSTNGTLTAIQDAITAALAAGGGTVKLRRGTYAIATGVTIDGNDVDLVGEGAATIIHGTITDIITLDNTTSGYINGVSVRNMTLLMEFVNGIAINEYGGVLIENIHFDHSPGASASALAAIVLAPTISIETNAPNLNFPVTIQNCHYTGYYVPSTSFNGVFFKYIASTASATRSMAPQLLNCTATLSTVWVYIQNPAAMTILNCRVFSDIGLDTAGIPAIFLTDGVHDRSLHVGNCNFDIERGNVQATIFETASVGNIVNSKFINNQFNQSNYVIYTQEIRDSLIENNTSGSASGPIEAPFIGATNIYRTQFKGNQIYAATTSNDLFEISGGLNNVLFEKNEIHNTGNEQIIVTSYLRDCDFIGNFLDGAPEAWLVYTGTSTANTWNIKFIGNTFNMGVISMVNQVPSTLSDVEVVGNIIRTDNVALTGSVIGLQATTVERINIVGNDLEMWDRAISVIALNTNGATAINVSDNVCTFDALADNANANFLMLFNCREASIINNDIRADAALAAQAIRIRNEDLNGNDEFYIEIAENRIFNMGNNDFIIEFQDLPVTGGDANPNFRNHVRIHDNTIRAVGTAFHIESEIPINKWQIVNNQFFDGSGVIAFTGDENIISGNHCTNVATSAGQNAFLVETNSDNNLLAFNIGNDATDLIEFQATTTGNQALYNRGTITDGAANNIVGTF